MPYADPQVRREWQRKYMRRRYWKNPNKARAYASAWAKENREKINVWRRRYAIRIGNQKRREQYRGGGKEERERNRIKCLAYRRKHHERYLAGRLDYIARNREKVRMWDRARYQRDKVKRKRRNKEWYSKDGNGKRMHRNYYAKNRLKVLAANKEYQRIHPHVKTACSERHRCRKKSAEGHFSAAEWIEVCKRFDNRCAHCRLPRKLTVDHVIPLSKSGTNWISNIQPLCQSCNARKHNHEN